LVAQGDDGITIEPTRTVGFGGQPEQKLWISRQNGPLGHVTHADPTRRRREGEVFSRDDLDLYHGTQP
jgi:hypothetical protein